MAWYQVSDYVPSGGPVAAGAAKSVIGGGWIDLHGAQWSIDSANNLSDVANTSPWNTGELIRPSSESMVDSRVRSKFTYGSSNPSYSHGHRWSNAGTAGTGYAIQYNGSNFVLYTFNNGAYTSLANVSAAQATAGTTYILDTSVVQTDSATTTLTATLYAADGTTVLATYNKTDTTAARQNVSAPCSFWIYDGGPASNRTTRLTTYTDVPPANAASYTLTGPSSVSVGNASAPFTVTPNGTVSVATTIVPSDGGAGGTFSPTSVTLASGSAAAATFTYTASSTGSKTISTTNNQGLTDPSPLTVSAVSTVLVTNPAFHFSPANWKGDTGRGGSAYRQTWNLGAYFDFVWTAGASSPTANLLLGNSANSIPITYQINGVLYQKVATASLSSLAIQGVAAGQTNSLRVYVATSPFSSSWNGTNILQVQGVQLDAGSSPGVAPVPAKWGMVVGDSIDVGFNLDSFLQSSVYYLIEEMRRQGYDVSSQSQPTAGFLQSGQGGVPALYSNAGGTYNDSASRWNKIDQGVSVLDTAGQISAYGATGTPPSFILLNFGTNDTSATAANLTASVSGVLSAYQTAAPSAAIIFAPGFPLLAGSATNSSATVAALLAGSNAFKTASPSANYTYADFTSVSQFVYSTSTLHGDSLHPTALGNLYFAAGLTGAVTKAVAPTTGGTSAPRFANTFH